MYFLGVTILTVTKECFLNFYIFRHGQTDWNAERRIQGHTDIELNDQGRSQAKELKEKVSRLGIQEVFSSDLKRAYETASIALPELNIESRESLREAHFGKAEGRIFTEVIEELGADYFKTHPKYWDLRIEGSETKRECIERVWKALNQIAKSSKSSHIGISSHGGVIRNIVHSLLPPDSEKIEIPNCCVYHLTFKDEKWELVGLLK
ncbi:MAG: broad specificity phosphatase PhoE [Bacteriovoracaceae bacterium]|jgi:broad specificity phosphatase PhoE